MLPSHGTISTLLPTFNNGSVSCDEFLLPSSLEGRQQKSFQSLFLLRASTNKSQRSHESHVPSSSSSLSQLSEKQEQKPLCLKERKAKEVKGVHTNGHLTRRKIATASSSFSYISLVVNLTSVNTVKFLTSFYLSLQSCPILVLQSL